ncbi:MAG: hypothetical protein ACRDRZ_16255 [Pseudonocardiaceae bacterium]
MNRHPCFTADRELDERAGSRPAFGASRTDHAEESAQRLNRGRVRERGRPDDMA